MAFAFGVSFAQLFNWPTLLLIGKISITVNIMDPDGEYIGRHSTASALDPSEHFCASFGGKADDDFAETTRTSTDKNDISKKSSNENPRRKSDAAGGSAEATAYGEGDFVPSWEIADQELKRRTSQPFDNSAASKVVEVVTDANAAAAAGSGVVLGAKQGVQEEDEVNVLPPLKIHRASSEAPALQDEHFAASSKVATGDTSTFSSSHLPMPPTLQDPPEEMFSDDHQPSSDSANTQIDGTPTNAVEERDCGEPTPSAPPLPSAESSSAVAVPIGLDADNTALPVADIVPIIDNSTVVPPRSATEPSPIISTPSSSGASLHISTARNAHTIPSDHDGDVESGSRRPSSRHSVDPGVRPIGSRNNQSPRQEPHHGGSGASPSALSPPQTERKSFAPSKAMICAAVFLVVVAAAIGIAVALRPEPEPTPRPAHEPLTDEPTTLSSLEPTSWYTDSPTSDVADFAPRPTSRPTPRPTRRPTPTPPSPKPPTSISEGMECSGSGSAWILGKAVQNCNAVCRETSRTCSATAHNSLTRAEFRSIAASIGIHCDSTNPGAWSGNPVLETDNGVSKCYYDTSGSSSCGRSGSSNDRRICCCIDVAPVPRPTPRPTGRPTPRPTRRPTPRPPAPTSSEYHHRNGHACRSNSAGNSGYGVKNVDWDLYEDKTLSWCKDKCSRNSSYCRGFEWRSGDGKCEIWRTRIDYTEVAGRDNGRIDCYSRTTFGVKTSVTTPEPTESMATLEPTSSYTWEPTWEPTTEPTSD